MRPIAKRQNTLRYPLNSILGTEANVRVLRALSFTSSSRPYSDLARETGLSSAGLRHAVACLENAGLADVLGASSKQVRYRREHPLSSELASLFRAEVDTWRDLVDQLRTAFEDVEAAPISVWIVTPEPEGPGEIAGQLVVCILANAGDVNAIRQSAEPAIAKLEAAQDLMIELRPLTRPDLRALSLSDRDRLVRGTPVFGPDPSVFLEDTRSPKDRRKRPTYTHAKHDVRSLALGAAIAEAIMRDPGLIERAHTLVTKRLKRASASERHELREWERVLRASPLKLRRLLVDPGERATRLRQTLPFLDALPREERDAIVASVGDSDLMGEP
jgi:hypothetical protein